MATLTLKELRAERGKVRITDKTRTQTFDLNTVFEAFYLNTPEDLEPLDNALSIISGAPAICYKRTDYDLLLTKDEVRRLVLLALTPTEFFSIYRKVGDIFEIHDDFYDLETGFALQPSIDIPQFWPHDTNDFFFADLYRDSLQDASHILQTTLFSLADDLAGLHSQSLGLGALDSRFTLQEKGVYNPQIKNAVVVLATDTLAQPKAVADINYLIECGVRIIPVWIDVSRNDVLPYLPALKESEGIAFQELDMQEMIGSTTTEDGTTIPRFDFRKAPKFSDFVQTIMWSVLPQTQMLAHLQKRSVDLAIALAYSDHNLESHVQALETIKDLAAQITNSGKKNQANLASEIASIAHNTKNVEP